MGIIFFLRKTWRTCYQKCWVMLFCTIYIFLENRFAVILTVAFFSLLLTTFNCHFIYTSHSCCVISISSCFIFLMVSIGEKCYKPSAKKYFRSVSNKSWLSWAHAFVWQLKCILNFSLLEIKLRTSIKHKKVL